ncbi:pilus assembly protein [Novosphingobium sp. KCTC 2891]|uniref:TadE/TadG family type IV pilus assembly protein n=1 Tax=Novosphingobium sp. KCTC 2891 TaxID=2989730 RepID=UPI0022214BD6|nr:TadE/TadG family type IV pilus assembly protein [Novosphingobium sp. KCTC 2891]MCW1383492.1 pilus assembly protein [Novosphingobium sp. KCTC 2891]
MIRLRRLLGHLAGTGEGSVVVEFAFIAPLLALMGLGTVDVTRMVARRTAVQASISESVQIVLAASPDTDAKIATLKSIISATTSVPVANIAIVTVYRCGTDTTYVSLPGYCSVTGEISKYLQVSVTDTFTPFWTKFGVGKASTMTLKRTIQLS